MIKIIDLGIILENNLIICDIHIGIEESFAKQGILIPKFHFKDVKQRICKIMNESGIERFNRIIINGDIKHEFAEISDAEWRDTLSLIDYLKELCDEIIMIKGNHDNILGPIASKKHVKMVDYLKIKDCLIIHGDIIPENNIYENVNMIIIGHEHPAIRISEGAKSEKFKCYLTGRWNGFELIVQPSFNLLTEGTDILSDNLLSPFLEDISEFSVRVVGTDRILDFGKVKNLAKSFKKI